MPVFVLDSEQMRKADRIAIEAFAIPGVLLMEAAARGVAREAMEICPPGGRVMVLAGPGNNGGDGLAAARMLFLAGIRVEVVAARPLAEYAGDSGINAQIVARLGIPVSVFSGSDASLDPGIFTSLAESHVVVDGLLGTGVRGELRPGYRELIRWANEVEASVVAVDVPTGVDPDTARVADGAVRADVTVTFGAPKLGLLLEPGCEWVGELVVEDIGIPAGVLRKVVGDEGVYWVQKEDVQTRLPGRSRTGHKGTYGHVLVVGGAPGYAGAAIMASYAALRSGAGLVTCAVPEGSVATVATSLVEAMTEILPPGPGLGALETKLDAADVVALGPGLGAGEGTSGQVRGLIGRAARATKRPFLVVDADGLNAVAPDLSLFDDPGWQGRVVLTPHPGEMARLLDRRIPEVLEDRRGAALEAAASANSVVVLKGAPSIIASPCGRLAVNGTGNPGLATGGSGDVLTGMIAAFLGQGLDPWWAAVAGCFVHGQAADDALEGVDARSMLPRDVIGSISGALRSLG